MFLCERGFFMVILYSLIYKYFRLASFYQKKHYSNCIFPTTNIQTTYIS